MKNTADEEDRDWIPLQPISEFMDEIIHYVKNNLNIYTKQDGTIDYLSLNNDPSVFTAKNKRRVRETLSSNQGGESARLSSLGNLSAGVQDSIESQGYIR